MIYLYDDAIAKDLSECISPNDANSVIKITGAEGVTQLLAQLQEDRVKFPCVCLTRNSDISIDDRLTNFTRLHRGVPVTFDTDSHNIYFEKSIPIQLSYDITVLTTNAIDMDEMIKELLFKYSSMYWLSMELPYESSRTIQFGVSMDFSKITRSSGNYEYLSAGSLYQSIIPLEVHGAVLLSYTPQHLLRTHVSNDVNLK